MSIFTFAHHHGSSVTLPAATYWIGDPTAIGYLPEDLHPNVDDHNLEGLYTLNGVVAGAFCRSEWPNADYGIDLHAMGIELAPHEGLHVPGPGLSILPVDIAQSVELAKPQTTQWISGFLVKMPAPFIVDRYGYDGSDIKIVNLAGRSLINLALYVQRT